jgi:hypothetical protein
MASCLPAESTETNLKPAGIVPEEYLAGLVQDADLVFVEFTGSDRFDAAGNGNHIVSNPK